MNGLRRAWLASLALLIPVVLGLGFLLGNESAGRWLLQQVPGLSSEGFSGRLGGNWQAEQLVWQQGQDRIELKALDISWSPACLLRWQLCIERLQAERLDMHFAAGEPADSQPITLPELSLPLSLKLEQLQLGSLWLNNAEQLRELQLSAGWTAQGLQIKRLALLRDDLTLELQGQVDTRGDWPLALRGALQLPEVEQQAWNLALQVSGNLRQRLQLQVESSGYLDGRLSGEVQALAEHLPAQLNLEIDSFKASAELPQTLRLQQLQLTAKGDLQAGYRIKGSAGLGSEAEPVALALQALLNAQGMQLEQLRLSAEDQQQIELSGELDWQQALSVDSSFSWQDFPWQRLYPMEQPPPVILRTLQGELAYAQGNYLGYFAAELDGPAGAFSLQSPLSGDLTQVFLPEVKLAAGQGRVEGQARLGFAGALEWQAQLQVSGLDPAYWLAELPGTLDGTVQSQGSLVDDQLQLDTAIDLDGRLRGQPARLQTRLSGKAQRWELSALQLRLGDNRIDGQGHLQEQLQGQFSLRLPRLGQLWPGLQGRLEGQLKLAGSLSAPQGQFNLNGQRLVYGEQRLQALQLSASLDAAQRGALNLQGRGLASGDSELGQLRLKGSGNLQQHQLELSLSGPQLDSLLALEGGLKQGDWRGRLSRGELSSSGQDWRLQQPASLERLADGRLNLGAHCWRSGAASLCADNQRLLPEPSLRYHLRDLPMTSLSRALPQDFRWQGQLNGELQLDLPSSGPTGQIELDAGSGTWQVLEQGQWLDFAYSSLRLSSQLRPQRIDNLIELRGPRLGNLSLQAQLDPRPAAKPLTGSFRLEHLDLAIARPFLPLVERLVGQLDGQGTLSGTLLAPQVQGQVRLSDGEIGGSQLPIEFSQLQLQAQIRGNQLQLDGNWRSGEQGQGRLDGELHWAEGLRGELQVRGTDLPLRVEPYAQLQLDSDLRLGLQDQQLSVQGRVDIPRGAIAIRELPPSTVQVSQDAQIVGREPDTASSMDVRMDIDVQVGRERLSFSGFGLDAELAGRVHIGDNLDTRGELQLNKGRFRAYGQRLNIRRARLLFAGPIDQPFLDVEAIRRVDGVVAGLRLSGSAEQPRSEVFSEPAMSQEQALSYLVMGRPLGQAGGDSAMLAQAALALGMAGTSPLFTGIAETLGIGDFQMDTEGSGLTTSVVASGQLSERLSLRYGVGVFEPAGTLALRYDLTRKLYLEAASGLASSLDIFYRRDF